MVFKMRSFALLVSLALLVLCLSSARAQVEQNYVDDEDGSVKSFDPNQQFTVRVANKSNYRVDVYWDDDMYGKHMAILEKGGESTLNTFVGHRFFITKHGVKEGLFDPETDMQHKFEAQKPNQLFEIRADAAPSTNPCQDRFSNCAKMAANNQCMSSPGWMIVHCCKSCDEALDASRLLDPTVRCNRENLNMTGPAWKSGDLNLLFKAWATEDKYEKYEPQVLSSPGGEFGGAVGPWVMIFDNFLTDSEAEALIKGGQLEGFERSTDQGASNALGEQEKVVSRTRTSSNAWCMQKCEALPGVRRVTDKIEEVTGIPRVNYESFQILEYGYNQFYRSHHDTSSTDRTPAGQRIMTFFLYLSDVEEGGETYFNKLDLAVKPKKGRALVWPSVTDDDPETWDPRMYHEARDVIKGKKMAANHWIHLYDYRTPNFWGCTGSFS